MDTNNDDLYKITVSNKQELQNKSNQFSDCIDHHVIIYIIIPLIEQINKYS